MTENPLVSVIIPIYKVENYLCQCVDSVINQTYKNLEIILIDDGSPDRCPEICDEYAKKDSRIKVIHKPNGGLSDARNVGLDNSTGDYVMFIDSDDFWNNTDDLMYLVNKIIEFGYPDFIGFNMYNYFSDTKQFIPWIPYDDSITEETDKESLIIELVKTGTFPMSACSKIIKRDFLITNNIFFKKGILSEDIPWFLELLKKAQNIRFISNYIYCYRKQRVGSITNKFSPKKYYDVHNIVENAIIDIRETNYKIETKNALLSFCAYYFCILLGEHRNFESNQRSSIFANLKTMTWLFDYDVNPKVKKVKLIYSIFGLKMTSIICNLYLKYILK